MTQPERLVFEAMSQSLSHMINRNVRDDKKHFCLCGCGKTFKPYTRYHQFYSKNCYQRTHRVKGFVKRFIDHKD